MKSRRKLLLSGIACLVMVGGFGPSLQAQYGAEPQAQSADEYDQYLELSEPKTPREFLIQARGFEKAWPDSALLAIVNEQELEAYESLGELASAEKAGEEALRRIPDNLRIMAELAYLIADSSDEKAPLARAQLYAGRVLELLVTFQIPRRISPADWAEVRAALEKKAHTALGLVAFKESKLDEAETQFATALEPGGQEDLSLQFRLGVVYRLNGHNEQARESLTRAASSSELELRERALRELKQMEAPR